MRSNSCLGPTRSFFSDYAKGVITPAICQSLIMAARKLGIPVLVDPKGNDYSFYRGATTICPNLVELAASSPSQPRQLDGGSPPLRRWSLS